MLQPDNTKIHLAYIETSNGPWILIFGSMLSDFSPLVSLFDDFSSGKKQYCELHNESYIIPHDNIEVIMRSLSSRKILSDLQQKKSDSLIFEWCCSIEIWEDCMEKTAYLADAPDSGHQYVFAQAISETLVVVSRGEYSEDIHLLL